MYSSEDLKKFYFQYQTEALPHGDSEMVQGNPLRDFSNK